MKLIPDDLMLPKQVKNFYNGIERSYYNELLRQEEHKARMKRMQSHYYDTDDLMDEYIYRCIEKHHPPQSALFDSYYKFLKKIITNSRFGLSANLVCGRGGLAKILWTPDKEYIVPFPEYICPESKVCKFNQVIPSFILKINMRYENSHNDTFVFKRYKPIKLFYPDIDYYDLKVSKVHPFPYWIIDDSFLAGLGVPIEYTNLRTELNMNKNKPDEKFVKKYINKRRTSK